ncbi:MAG: sigma 54-dependent transcriptional regulator, partial [Pseudomonadales bacterium]|nr:sigma 54-dependent transcriptional regulator [Pseudomonadales bacterium]
HVQREIDRLKSGWQKLSSDGESLELLSQYVPREILETLDRFDRAQLIDVVGVCKDSPTLAHAGRILFNRSRLRLQKSNDSDRLGKYLRKHGLSFESFKDY